MAKGLNRVPVREQEPKVRATNFDEVCLGYNKDEAVEEAQRCLGCKNAKCITGCPVNINIPAFIAQVKEGNFEEAYKLSVSPVHSRQSAAVYVRRRASARANVSAESKATLFPSVNWSVSLLTGQKKTVSNRFRQQRKTATRSRLSVPALQVLPAQETLQNLATM